MLRLSSFLLVRSQILKLVRQYHYCHYIVSSGGAERNEANLIFFKGLCLILSGCGEYFGPLTGPLKLANFSPILLCDSANIGVLWVGNSFLALLNLFRHVFYPYPCPKMAQVFCFKFWLLHLYFVPF